MAENFAEMFVDIDADPRAEPPERGDERATLSGFLRWHRQTLELKCSGLDAEALARRALDPSGLSLLGLVRHMADVERGWFRHRLAGQDAPARFRLPDDPDGDFDHATADPAVVAEAWAAWREEAAFTDRCIAELPDLDVTIEHPNHGRLSARWVLVHIVEEYARHNGHADILRERIDGRVGQ
ncbi:MAG: DinB family protein [bacterium]